MKTRKRNAIRFLPLLTIPMAFAIAGTGARSAAELPPAPCKEDAMTRASSPGKSRNPPVVQQKAVPRNLAILIFDGVQIIDYTGPYETFGHAYADDGPAFNIYTVSEKAGPITTAMGMTVTPNYSFENVPRPDVLLIPGGGVKDQVANANVIKWVQDKSKDAEVVMSVCNGAFILATTAGLSSGIDGSLHVIERFFGRGTAQMAALGMEYNWDPESKFVRAALADKYMRFNYDVKVLPGGWKPLSREGGLDGWEKAGHHPETSK